MDCKKDKTQTQHTLGDIKPAPSTAGLRLMTRPEGLVMEELKNALRDTERENRELREYIDRLENEGRSLRGDIRALADRIYRQRCIAKESKNEADKRVLYFSSERRQLIALLRERQTRSNELEDIVAELLTKLQSQQLKLDELEELHRLLSVVKKAVK